MGGLVVRPLHLGTIRRDKSTFTYLRNIGVQIDAPVLAWYVEGEGHRILVDTGGHDPREGELHPPYVRTPEQDPVAALATLGVHPDEIDTVILTHLHWDHAGNAHLFPKARLIVQLEELRYAAAPLPPHRWAYQAHAFPLPPSQGYETVEGDVEIVKGVTAHLTPGHTPGLQGVAVRTSGAVYFIASDNVPLMEMWNAVEKYGTAHWVDANHVDLDAYYRSLRRMEDLGDVILPSHDWGVLERREYR